MSTYYKDRVPFNIAYGYCNNLLINKVYKGNDFVWQFNIYPEITYLYPYALYNSQNRFFRWMPYTKIFVKNTKQLPNYLQVDYNNTPVYDDGKYCYYTRAKQVGFVRELNHIFSNYIELNPSPQEFEKTVNDFFNCNEINFYGVTNSSWLYASYKQDFTPYFPDFIYNPDWTCTSCSELTKAIVTDSFITMNGTYSYCSKITEAKCGPNVRNMSNTYFHCPNITEAACGINVTNMIRTYGECDSITEAVCGPNVINMTNAYCQCNNLINGAIGPKVTELNYAYENCYNLKKTGLSSSQMVRNARATYSHCFNLEDFIMTDQLNDISYMYTLCYNMEGEMTIGKNVHLLSAAFQGCVKMTGDISQIKNYSWINYTFWGCPNVTGKVSEAVNDNVYNMEHTFQGCSNVTGEPVLPEGISSLNGTYWFCTNLTGSPKCSDSVVHLENAYKGCVNLTGIPVCGPNVKNLYETYCYCYNLYGQAACGEKVIDMDNSYRECLSIYAPNVGPNVIYMNYAFYDCFEISSIVFGPNVKYAVSAYETQIQPKEDPYMTKTGVRYSLYYRNEFYNYQEDPTNYFNYFYESEHFSSPEFDGKVYYGGAPITFPDNIINLKNCFCHRNLYMGQTSDIYFSFPESCTDISEIFNNCFAAYSFKQYTGPKPNIHLTFLGTSSINVQSCLGHYMWSVTDSKYQNGIKDIHIYCKQGTQRESSLKQYFDKGDSLHSLFFHYI